MSIVDILIEYTFIKFWIVFFRWEYASILSVASLIVGLFIWRFNKSKLVEEEKEPENHCHLCGGGHFFQVDWPKEVLYVGPAKPIKDTSMVGRALVYRLTCPKCKSLSAKCEEFETIPAPRFNYNRHL